MCDKLSVLRAMKEELGKDRLDALPLANQSGATYRPSRTRVVQTPASRQEACRWQNKIKSGDFNDSDAAAVSGLSDLGGPRAHDPRAPRLAVRPPPAGAVARSTPTLSVAGKACPPLRTSPTDAASGPSLLKIEAKAQSGTGHGNLPLPAPSRGNQLNAPPTPAQSPSAPASKGLEGKPTQAGLAAAIPASPPKPGRGLRASRWATEENGPNLPVKGEAQEPPQVPEFETKYSGRQPTVQSCSSASKSCEATQALSELKITDDNMGAGIKPGCVDPMTGQRLGPEDVHATKAWLSVGTPVGKTLCCLYLGVKNPNCPVFEVFVPGEPRATHNLLNLLGQSHGGVFLDLAFRLGANNIVRYSFELGTEGGASEFLEAMEDLRELTVQALSEELRDLVRTSRDAIVAKQSAGLGFARSSTDITTVAYPLPAPIRNKCNINSEAAKPIDTVQATLISQADNPSQKPQRRVYTQDELTSLRNKKTSAPLFMLDDDFIRAVRQPGHKKTDSEECVVGMTTNRSSQGTDMVHPSAILDRLRQMVSEGHSWVSRNGDTGL